jgi:hypothetical protein
MPVDLSKILKINPSSRLEEDHLAWAPVKHGLLTVRSAHGLAMEDILCESNVSTSSSSDGLRKV